MRGRPSGALATGVDARIRQAEADHAAREREREAFRQQLPGDPARASAERGVNRQLLLSRLGPDQEQVGNSVIDRRQADGAEEHPEDTSDVAIHVGRERPDVGADLDVVEHLAREAGRHREPNPG